MDRPFKKDRSIFLFRQVRPRFPAVSTITLCTSYNLVVETHRCTVRSGYKLFVFEIFRIEG